MDEAGLQRLKEAYNAYQMGDYWRAKRLLKGIDPTACPPGSEQLFAEVQQAVSFDPILWVVTAALSLGWAVLFFGVVS